MSELNSPAQSGLGPSRDLLHLDLHPRAARDTGFDEVLGILRGLCASPYGLETLDAEVFPGSVAALTERVAEALETKELSLRRVSPDFAALKDVRPTLLAVEKGVVLGPLDLLDAAKVLDGLHRLRDLFDVQDDLAPKLSARGRDLDDDRRFSRRLLRSFDETGALTDDASPELAAARARVRRLREEAQEQLQGLVRDFDEQGLLRDRNFTVRNDRYVLPVKSEFQGRVEGIVHDASQTHQTVFIEPRALLQLGNRIKIARADVEQEEQRILGEMTAELGEHAHRLRADLQVAGYLEAAFVRGTFAAKTAGADFELATDGAPLSLRRARHPLLLWLREQAVAKGESRGPVVGNDIAFGAARALVITGPNAGGKTVALKTAALIAVCARAGLPVPVGDGSVVPAYAAVVTSIGDEQSLAGELSSFSGHLVTLRQALQDVQAALPRGPVLCVVDELMAGTDPAQGAALAQALLERLVEQGAHVVATTHFERLKALAVVRPTEFRNAAVALDQSGRPTFTLRLDTVGVSNAFEAARRYQLEDAVIARAEELLAPDQKELSALLSTLAEKTGALESQLQTLSQEREGLLAERERLALKLDQVEREATRLRREGKRAFVDELQEARAQVHAALQAARDSKDPGALTRLRDDLKELDTKTRAESEAPPEAQRALAPGSVKKGDVVETSAVPGARLTVLSIEGSDAVLAKGALKMRVPLDQLLEPRAEKPSKAERAAGKGARRKGAPGDTPDTPPAAVGAEPRSSDNSLDVRGQRADDAIELVEAFLDRLLHAGRTKAFILHGHGSGAIKKALRDALRGSRYVRSHAAGDAEDGGDGWTVVTLRDDATL